MSRALSLSAYLALSRAAAPACDRLLARRLALGKEDPARIAERRGEPGAPRPDGPLVWLHGASVGEGLVALTLARRLRAGPRAPTVLLTTGTRTSAEVIGSQTPAGVIHQYAPLDAAAYVARFLDHWRPAAAIRVDSELWPATLALAHRRGVRLGMVNARVSALSARRWARWAPGLARAVLAPMALALAQDADSAARLRALGAAVAVDGGALKAAAPPPDADPAALEALRAAVGGRAVWAAVSTHSGEDAAALDAAAGRPDLLTLIAPRHPERGAEIAALAAARGLRVARRSAGEGAADADVYVADTLGEMGLWLRLAPVAFVGGSLVPVGGHNPYEPAALGAAILHGPHVASFADAYRALADARAAWAVRDAAGLGEALRAALADGGAEARRRADAARAALAGDPAALDRAAAAVLALAAR